MGGPTGVKMNAGTVSVLSMTCYGVVDVCAQLELAFKEQLETEERARVAEKERQERERIEARKQREVQRITDVSNSPDHIV